MCLVFCSLFSNLMFLGHSHWGKGEWAHYSDTICKSWWLVTNLSLIGGLLMHIHNSDNTVVCSSYLVIQWYHSHFNLYRVTLFWLIHFMFENPRWINETCCNINIGLHVWAFGGHSRMNENENIVMLIEHNITDTLLSGSTSADFFITRR